MKVTTVTATIKYSLDTGHGWKAVELGAEATLDAKDTWQTAQRQLYGELSQQLQKLWANGKAAHNGSESQGEAPQDAEPPEPPPETPAHYCQEHQAEVKRYERQGKVWYSHKTADGKWCKEK